MTRPLLVDLYCGAGGATAGYVRAGFDVVGIDVNPQPNYLKSGAVGFVQADALTVLRALYRGYSLDYVVDETGPYSWISLGDVAAFHASPPCQYYSGMTVCRPGLAETYPDLIGPSRDLLERCERPYVLENVMGARAELRGPVVLCMDVFGHPEISRDRLFETSFPLHVPPHKTHKMPRTRAGRWEKGYAIAPVGHFPHVREVRAAMEVPWMTRDEIAESVPPVMTEAVGKQLMAVLDAGRIALAS